MGITSDTCSLSSGNDCAEHRRRAGLSLRELCCWNWPGSCGTCATSWRRNATVRGQSGRNPNPYATHPLMFQSPQIARVPSRRRATHRRQLVRLKPTSRSKDLHSYLSSQEPPRARPRTPTSPPCRSTRAADPAGSARPATRCRSRRCTRRGSRSRAAPRAGIRTRRPARARAARRTQDRRPRWWGPRRADRDMDRAVVLVPVPPPPYPRISRIRSRCSRLPSRPSHPSCASFRPWSSGTHPGRHPPHRSRRRARRRIVPAIIPAHACSDRRPPAERPLDLSAVA